MIDTNNPSSFKKIKFEEKVGFIYPSENFKDFGCMMSGELITIVAESNSGKTTFAMDLLEKNAQLGRRGYYVNLEFAIETMRQSRRLRLHGKKKDSLTNLNPLSEDEKKDMELYVSQKLNQFDYYNNPNGIDLKELIQLITTCKGMGYDMVVIDTFSRIKGNLEQQNARTSQNRCMEELQELAQQLNIAIVMLHHTNRAGTFEGSQKIMDLSNVFIMIEKETDAEGEEYRRYTLMKDKYTPNAEVELYYHGGKYEF